MTIRQFAEIKNRKIDTVLKWIYEGLIPGASVDSDFVPASAREPCLSRAKKADSIYYSIVKACVELKHVTPKTYGICAEEFEGYIKRLIDAGFIEERITDGIKYYDATIKSAELKKKIIIETVEAVVRGASEGTTTAVLNYR